MNTVDVDVLCYLCRVEDWSNRILVYDIQINGIKVNGLCCIGRKLSFNISHSILYEPDTPFYLFLI